MKKLAIVSSHPIQYNAPLFALLSSRGNIQIKVFYTWGKAVLKDKYDPGFGKVVNWDIPLLEGYEYSFVENIAAAKGSHHFNGIINPSLKDEIIAWKADAVLVYGWSFKSHLSLMKSLKGKLPVFFRGDSTLLDKSSIFKYFLRKIYLRNVYRHVDKAFFVGKQNKAYFKWTGLQEDQLIFAPHAIDNNRFREVVKSRVTSRETFGIAQDEFVFLFAGKLEPKKNPGLLLESFIELADPVAALVIVGEGPLLQDLKDKAKGHLRIHFLPFQNQLMMPSIYQMADCFVLPSQGPGETWGLAINEAMASGIPIIASNKCGATTDLVEDGTTGYSFAYDKRTDLLQAMKKMIERSRESYNWTPALEKKINRFSLDELADSIESGINNFCK